MKRLFIPLLAIAALPAPAAEYVWANLTGTGELTWNAAANWINADGTPATSYPKSASDTAVFHGCVAGISAPQWGSSIGTVRMESGYTKWKNNSLTIGAFSCAPFASFSWQCEGKNNPYFTTPGLTEADNVDGFYPNAAGMQTDQHKFFCRISGSKPIWAGDGASYAAHPTNRTDMLYNAGTGPYSLSVAADSRYGVVCWNTSYGNLSFSSDAVLEVGSGLILGGGNDWSYMTVGEPGSAGTAPAGTIRVPDGHALWFWGDKHWLLRSRVDAASLVVTRKQRIYLLGDHSEDPCDYRVVSGTLQLGGDLPVTSSNCRSAWWPNHATGAACVAGTGDFFVEWAGTLAVGAENAIPKTATISVTSAYDRPTGTTIHGKIRLDTDTRCGALLVDGKKSAGGTWGATGSGADHVDDAIFSGTGVLAVGTDPLLILVK